jgi:hypothetical protein
MAALTAVVLHLQPVLQINNFDLPLAVTTCQALRDGFLKPFPAPITWKMLVIDCCQQCSNIRAGQLAVQHI